MKENCQSPHHCKLFTNEALFSNLCVPTCRSEIPSSRATPINAIVLLNSPTVGEWEFDELSRLYRLYRSSSPETSRPSASKGNDDQADALPMYVICADGAYTALQRHSEQRDSIHKLQFIPDVVIGDMDSCDKTLLPSCTLEASSHVGTLKSRSSDTKEMYFSPTIADLSIEVLQEIRERMIRSTQFPLDTQHSPVFVHISCQMTTDFQKAIHLLQRLEEAFPIDFLRFSCSPHPRGNVPMPLVMEADESIEANELMAHYESLQKELCETIHHRPAGAWAEGVSLQDQEAERHRVVSLLNQVHECVKPALMSHGNNCHHLCTATSNSAATFNGVTMHVMPTVVAYGALGGRFDHEMGALSCMLEHSSRFHILLCNSHNIITACLPNGITQWIPYHGLTHGEKSSGCGVIPFGRVKELETTGLLYNIVNGRPEKCDTVTQTGKYCFEFGGLLSTSNEVTDSIVTVDLRPLHKTLAPQEDGNSVLYNPPTILSVSRLCSNSNLPVNEV